MTRDQLKRYLSEAVDALGQEELEQLFPAASQPDLYTLASELTGLRGEIRKLAQSTLKLNNNVQSIVQEQKELNNEPATIPEASHEIHQEIRQLLNGLLEQEDNIQRTATHLQLLPPLELFQYYKFKAQFEAWKKGYDIGFEKWQGYIKSLGIYKTGLVGSRFDPRYHEVVAVKQVPGMAENTIVETEVVGYLYHNQLVRQAKVVVNKL